jgi:1-acyl-sn-glycerol-3-phosphate acyltransferase
MVAWWRHFGIDAPAYGLMHDLPFRIPVIGDALARCGAVHARPANAVSLLGRGHKVLVYPGGDLDAFRPASKRTEIVFGERRGFIRVALRARVPIVPIVSVGAHDGFHVLSDGREMVRRLGFKQHSRIEAFPVALCLPWGLSFGPAPYLPWPVRIRIRVLPPLAWPELPPEAADDDALVAACRNEVLAAMQTALTALAAEGGHGRRTLFGD